MRRSIERFVTGAALSLLVALPAVAQDDTLPELFADVMDVRVVNVEVVVTDRKGKRIKGLAAEDFELRVDGEPVPVDYFAEVEDGYTLTSSDDDVGSVPSLAPDEPAGTNYLIFIDDQFAIKQRRDRVLRHLEQDLALLQLADRAAVVAFDGHDITRLSDWSNHHATVRQALGQARERRAHGRPGMSGLGDRTRRSVMAAAATVRSFAKAPGRKVMLLLVEGWAAPTHRWKLWSPWGSGMTSASLDSLYGPLVHAANLVGYSLYPIDLPGPLPRNAGPGWSPTLGEPQPAGESLTGGDSRGGNVAPYFSLPDWSKDTRLASEGRQHHVLEFLAEQTGGVPMINAYRDKALAKTVTDTRSYYWLGFEPPLTGSDALHKIKVRVNATRKLRVRSREHYVDMSRGTEVSMLVEGSLLFGGSPGTDSLGVRFGIPRKAGFRKISVPTEVTIPLDDLTLLPMDGRWLNELEFRVTLINEAGRLSEMPVRKLPVLRTQEPRPGDVFVYETELPMRKRQHRYVAAVYDPVSGALLSARGAVGPQ